MAKSTQSSNIEVLNFLDDIGMYDPDKLAILQKLRLIITKQFSATNEEIKYGGIVYLLDKFLFTGLFVRKNHISLEFVNGSEMNDPDKLLEGTGKFRRHLKIRSINDIKDKKVNSFVKKSLVTS